MEEYIIKKKIMHIVQSPGGVERYIMMMLRNIDLSIYDNILVCSSDYKEENYNGLVTAFEYVDMFRSVNLKCDLKAIFQIRRLIKKYKPDIIYMHSSKAGAVGRIANIGIENKSIYNPHGWAFNMDCGRKKKMVYSSIERLLAHFCDMIIAISEFEKKSAIQNNICKRNKIKVIFNGIDIDKYEKEKKSFTLTREILGIPSDAYVIGMVGRLSEQKAPDIFIKAAAFIKKEIPKSFFVLVGDGELRSKVEVLIEKSCLTDSVLITNWVDEPMEYIQLFDQAMLLSRWEGFGLVLPEYMVANKPIIATNVDAIPDLIKNEENGLIIEMDDVEAIKNTSVRIYKDKELSNSLITNGYQAVLDKYNIMRVITEHTILFDELISGV